MSAIRFFAATSILLLAACDRGSQDSLGRERPPVPVETLRVVRRDLVRKTTEMATCVAADSVEVAAEVSGKLVEVCYDEGETVEAGRVVARLDATIPKAQVAEKKAQEARAKARLVQASAMEARARAKAIEGEARVAQAEALVGTAESKGARAGADTGEAEAKVREDEASLTAARNVLAREEAIAAKGASSSEKFQTARDQVAIVEARVDRAKASLEAARAGARMAQKDLVVAGRDLDAVKASLVAIGAEIEAAQADVALATAECDAASSARAVAEATLAKYELTCPLAGVVVWRGKDPGEMVFPTFMASGGVLRVETLDPIHAETFLPEAIAGLVSKDDSVEVELETRRVPAKVFRVAPTVDPETRTVKVEIAIPNGDARIRSGSFGRAWFDLEEAIGVLAIPVTAVRRDVGGGVYVLVAKGDPVAGFVAGRVTVELGLDTGEWVEVVRGLDEGDLVVTRGASTLGDGGKIAPRAASEVAGS